MSSDRVRPPRCEPPTAEPSFQGSSHFQERSNVLKRNRSHVSCCGSCSLHLAYPSGGRSGGDSPGPAPRMPRARVPRPSTSADTREAGGVARRGAPSPHKSACAVPFLPQLPGAPHFPLSKSRAPHPHPALAQRSLGRCPLVSPVLVSRLGLRWGRGFLHEKETHLLCGSRQGSSTQPRGRKGAQWAVLCWPPRRGRSQRSTSAHTRAPPGLLNAQGLKHSDSEQSTMVERKPS